jgi:hypothetical protein
MTDINAAHGPEFYSRGEWQAEDRSQYAGCAGFEEQGQEGCYQSEIPHASGSAEEAAKVRAMEEDVQVGFRAYGCAM